MLVLGLSCTKDKLDWVVLDGADRQTATLVKQQQCTVPANVDRGVELGWVRKEILGILETHAVDTVVIRVAEQSGGVGKISPGRCEVEGVVQEALAAKGIRTVRAISVSIRGAFKAKNNAQLDDALAGIPVLQGVAATRRPPFISALSGMPA